MKDYVNFEALTRFFFFFFFNNLVKKFSEIGHTHTKSDITDLNDCNLSASDDGNGNVTLTWNV